MIYELVPQACKDSAEKPAQFSGSVTIDLPSFDDRCEIGERLIIALRDLPEDIAGLRRARESVKLAAERIKSVALVKKSNGKQYNTFAELADDITCQEIMTEICLAIVVGPTEGNA
jgi:hypothetical protein